MDNLDASFGLNPIPVQTVFNVLLRFFLNPEKIPATRSRLVEILSSPEDAGPQDNLVGESSVLEHAELAFVVLGLQANAFLADDQKIIFEKAKEQLFENWQQILREANALDTSGTAFDRKLLLHIDGLFLSQLEWMKDVGFLNCDLALRTQVFPESPVAGIFMVEK